MKYLIQEYAQKDGKTVHINAVRQGLDCKCVCPVCGEPLIARKGGVKAHHFAHMKNSGCKGTYEHNLKHVCRDAFEENSSFQLEVPVKKKGKILDALKQITVRVKKAIVGAKEESDIILYTNVGEIHIDVTDGADVSTCKNIPTIKCDVKKYVRASDSNEQFKKMLVREISKDTLQTEPMECEAETVEQKHRRLVRELQISREKEKSEMEEKRKRNAEEKKRRYIDSLINREQTVDRADGRTYDCLLKKLTEQVNGGENV